MRVCEAFLIILTADFWDILINGINKLMKIFWIKDKTQISAYILGRFDSV